MSDSCNQGSVVQTEQNLKYFTFPKDKCLSAMLEYIIRRTWKNHTIIDGEWQSEKSLATAGKCQAYRTAKALTRTKEIFWKNLLNVQYELLIILPLLQVASLI